MSKSQLIWKNAPDVGDQGFTQRIDIAEEEH
jgi:hypothetical protein